MTYLITAAYVLGALLTALVIAFIGFIIGARYALGMLVKAQAKAIKTGADRAKAKIQKQETWE